MVQYTVMTIYGRHIRSYGPYTVIAKWTIYGAYRAIYGRHRTKPYMVTIYGNRHLPYMAQNSTIYGPPYTGRPYMVILARPYMVDIDHIWACRNRPYMVIQPYTVNHIWCTIYGHTVYGAPYIVPRRPYIVPRWAYMVHHIREGPYMVEHIRDIHIWSTIYGHNRSIYGPAMTIYCPAMGIYGPPYTGCPYMVTHIWSPKKKEKFPEIIPGIPYNEWPGRDGQLPNQFSWSSRDKSSQYTVPLRPRSSQLQLTFVQSGKRVSCTQSIKQQDQYSKVREVIYKPWVRESTVGDLNNQ